MSRSTNSTLRDLSGVGSQDVDSSSMLHKSLTHRPLWKDLLLYRLKYIFTQSCSMYCRSIAARVPSGKAVYLILFMLALEQLAYTAASEYTISPFLTYILRVKPDYFPLVRSIVIYIAANILFPIMGSIADIWVGRYRMIHYSLWLLWLGYALTAMTYCISYVVEGHWYLNILPVCIIIISFGSAGFQANAIPFGADVIMYKTSQELSSYFYCYYWMRNFGMILNILTATCSDIDSVRDAGLKYAIFSVACISLAMSCYGCFVGWFKEDNERRNPYKKVIQVLFLTAVIKRPKFRSAFSFSGASPPSRINLTKKVHGGLYTNEEVEDVKTFLRLLCVLSFILITLVVYVGVTQAVPFQLHDIHATRFRINFSLPFLQNCTFSDTGRFTVMINVVTILLIIPLLNNVLYPFLRDYLPNMLKRFGAGLVCAVLSLLTMFALSAAGSNRPRDYPDTQCMFSADFSNISADNSYVYNEVSEYLIILPHTLITLSEILINVTSLEFFYAQSPHKMRGMMIGLFFFTWGIANTLGSSIFTVFSKSLLDSLPLTCDFWYYILYLLIGVLMIVFYVVLVRRYKNRQRGEQDSDLFYRPI